MKSVARHADRILCNSKDTETRVHHYFSAWGIRANTIVAHLGVEEFSVKQVRPQFPPYLCVLVRLSRVKNHALLFAVWEELVRSLPSEDIPKLHIIGRRGWKNESVFSLLDSSPLMGRYVQEYSNLSDEDLAEQICKSSGLLFPSFAEGFGLPGLEAAQMGVPVVCSDLPVFREVLSSYAHFCDPRITQEWLMPFKLLQKWLIKAAKKDTSVGTNLQIPTVGITFRHVFDDTGDRQVIHE